jgi:alanine dehydrogenase
MIIGVPKEIKKHEYRVGLTPYHAKSYVACGHTVFIQTKAGEGSGYADADYEAAGCRILPDAEAIYDAAQMIIKVKEPLEPEYALMREGQILYTYFHLAADRTLTEVCLKKKIIAVAYETIVGKDGRLPCLKPMSEIAGRLAIQEGAKYLEKPFGGRGVLLGGVPGVLPANVLILGAGVVGQNACAMAAGLHADVTIADISIAALTNIDNEYKGRVKTLFNTEGAVIEAISKADLVIGAALVPGAATPHIIKKEYLKYMKKGSVIVDVAIDQGGCCETSHVTYHDNPVYTYEDIVHYCVGNMPGAVPFSSTLALNNATLSYGLSIANKGYRTALKEDAGLALGLNCHLGKLTCRPVAELYNIEYTPASLIL